MILIIMSLRIKWIIAAVVIVVAVIVSLFASRLIMGPIMNHTTKLPPTLVPHSIIYGSVACNDSYNVLVPGNTTVVLVYHVHGNFTINDVSLVIDFPLSIINETLSVAFKLPNPENAMWLGIYVNGKLTAFDNQSDPIIALINAIDQPYPYVYYNTTTKTYESAPGKLTTFWQFVKAENIPAIYTDFNVEFSAIHVKSGDTIVIVLYSAVPYALPVCGITSEAEEVQSMVRNNLIGFSPPSPNAVPTVQQLVGAGQYITEVPTIYLMSKPPVARNPETIGISGIKPYMNNTAPIYIMAYSGFGG